MLRPQAARWFEVLVAQDDVAAALEALACTGAIELEVRAERVTADPMRELKPLLDRYTELLQRYGPYWPAPVATVARHLPARDVLEENLAQLGEWQAEVESLVDSLQALEQEGRELAIWRELFTLFQDSIIDFGRLRRVEGDLARRVYVFPPDVVFPIPPEVMARRFVLRDQACVLVLGPADAVANLDRQAAALRGRRSGLGIPDWLDGKANENLPRIEDRSEEVRARLWTLRNELDAINARMQLGRRIGEIERLRWFAGEVQRLSGTEHFAWLSGWTDDFDGARLEVALKTAGVRALLRFPTPPPGAQAPLVLKNPWWARPFELFARAIGVPSRNEVDPSLLLAAVVPLLFGYMFGDVGQGLVLFLVGWWLRKRFAVARLVMIGGGSAIAFGFLFGSIFSREDIIPALWLHPMSQPLTLLAIPLAAGAVLIALGQVLAAVEAHWCGKLREWMQADAGMLVMYVSLLLMLVNGGFVWLAAAGLLWYLLGHALHERSVAAFFAGIGAAIEHGFQLAVNTLSFARVGAFALAHAGLSSAIVSLADAAGNPVGNGIIMVMGNIVVIVLEGLVVSIQTTRLVLFEFFIRFLRGEGRAFRPLAAPPSTLKGDSHENTA